MTKIKVVDVCLTPHSIDLFDVSYKLVVVIDVFRATSAMCTALNSGIKEVIPVDTIDKAKTYLNRNNYLVAAERNGKIVSGFNLGNSPLEYIDNDKLKNRSLVMTTTNGTKSIEYVKGADSVILASFLNVNAVVKYILEQNKDIIIICSGWKDRVCLEDMLLAGMICDNLTTNKSILTTQDSVILVIELYKKSRKDMANFIRRSAYFKRMNLKEDIEYCLQLNTMNIVPILCNESFVV